MALNKPITKSLSRAISQHISGGSGDGGIDYNIAPNMEFYWDFTEAPVSDQYTDKINSHVIQLGDGATDKPTFNTDKLDFDGSSYLTGVSSNTAFLNDLAKAGSQYTFVFAGKQSTVAALNGLFATERQNGQTAMTVYRQNSSLSSRQVQYFNVNTFTSQNNITEADLTAKNILIVMSVDVDAGTIDWFINGTAYSASNTFAKAVSDPTDTFILCSRYNISALPLYPLTNGWEAHGIAFTSGLTDATGAASIKTNIEAITGRVY
jgi:hypothetical protein